jgi:hypothetical protein
MLKLLPRVVVAMLMGVVVFFGARFVQAGKLVSEAELEDDPLPPEVLKALNSPGEGAVLYSLKPRLADAEQIKAGKDFRGFILLGKTSLNAVQTAAATKEVINALKNFNGTVAPCFSPRHGLSIVYEKTRYDFLMCFECNRMAVYRNDDVISSPAITGSPARLNEMLKAAGLELAPGPGEPVAP